MHFACYPCQHTLRSISTNNHQSVSLAYDFVMARLISIKFVTNEVHLLISRCEWIHNDLSNIPTLDKKFEYKLVENHMLFCVRGIYFFLCFADNCLDLCCVLMGLLAVRFIPEFGIIFVQYSMLSSVCIFWFGSEVCLGAMFVATRNTWMWVQEIDCHPVVFLVNMGSKVCSIC